MDSEDPREHFPLVKKVLDRLDGSEPATTDGSEPTAAEAEADEIILSLFSRSCGYYEGLYDHLCASEYKEAQRYLIGKGLITQEQCWRK